MKKENREECTFPVSYRQKKKQKQIQRNPNITKRSSFVDGLKFQGRRNSAKIITKRKGRIPTRRNGI